MLLLLTSPNALQDGAMIPADHVVDALAQTSVTNPVYLLSNHPAPIWFEKTFANSGGVSFQHSLGRQSGGVVAQIARQHALESRDVLVLATKDDDVQMGKNGRAVLIAAGWSTDARVQDLGIRVKDGAELLEVVALTQGWNGGWWFAGDSEQYRVRALADLSSFYVPQDQETFGRNLTATVKNGGSRLNALLAVASRSLITAGVMGTSDLVWGVYPSSASTNLDDEVLSDFTHRLRTTVSRVRYASKGNPLFIRHRPSVKRSRAGGAINRVDPKDQVETIHLNPYYADKNRLVNKNVVVIDDCTTYGVSFGVAAAFLRAAGAASVAGVALGKIGNQLRQYDIKINSDPFAPVPAGSWEQLTLPSLFAGHTDATSQAALRALLA